jgi:hypothetical protein
VSTTPNAFGNFLSTPPPFISNYAAISGPFGTWIKPGGRIAAYVRSTGAQDGDDLFAMSGQLVATINEGCKRCRSGMGDVVVVLENHAESLAVADAIPDLVAGTTIISAGRLGASNNPTLTWSATASSLLLNVANVTIVGFDFIWNAVDGLVAPLTVSAAGCSLIGNRIVTEDASAGVLKGVEVTTGGSRFAFVGNTVTGIGEAQPMTSAVVLVSAAVDDVVISGNYIAACNPGTSVLGLVAVTAAATNVRITDNECIQLETAGTALFCITVGDVAASGVISRNNSKIGSAVTSTTSGVSVGTAGLVAVGLFDNKCVDAGTLRSGVLSPVVAD